MRSATTPRLPRSSKPAPIRVGRTAGSTARSYRLHPAPRARLGALGRGLGRGWARRRRVRRRERRPVRGRVDVPPADGCFEGCLPRTRGASTRGGRPPPPRRTVGDPASALTGCGRGHTRGVSPAARHRPSTSRRAVVIDACRRRAKRGLFRDFQEGITTSVRCRSTGRSRRAGGRARCPRSRRARTLRARRRAR